MTADDGLPIRLWPRLIGCEPTSLLYKWYGMMTVNLSIERRAHGRLLVWAFLALVALHAPSVGLAAWHTIHFRREPATTTPVRRRH